MRRGINLILVLALAVGCIVAGVKIVQINHKYPQVQIENIPSGEAAEMKDDVSMQILGTKWLTMEEAQESYGEDFTKSMDDELGEYNYNTVEVKIELKNTTAQEKSVPLYEICIENNIYSNGLAPEVFCSLEGNQEMEVTLSGNETKDITLGYLLYEMRFSKTQWKNRETSDFYLVNQRYPIKKRWKI